MKFKIKQEGVLRATGSMTSLRRVDIQELKKKTQQTRRKRIRICVHRSDEEIVQEMFIVHAKNTYVRPHKHLFKKESLHILEGRADIVLFNEKGNVQKAIPMGDLRSGLTFYLKLEHPTYHSMIISSDNLVFMEITNGPFRKNETAFAPWSPDETEYEAVRAYQQNLINDVNSIKQTELRK